MTAVTITNSFVGCGISDEIQSLNRTNQLNRILVDLIEQYYQDSLIKSPEKYMDDGDREASNIFLEVESEIEV